MAHRGRSRTNRGGAGKPLATFTPASLANLALWLRADTGISIAQGPVVSAGTTPPTVTMTGTPASSMQTIVITNTSTGTLGVAQFSWSLNGVTQQTGQTTTATFLLGTTGITAGFPAGTYTSGNTYTSVITVSQWADMGPGGHNVSQVTALKQPNYLVTDASFGGVQSLLFNGTNSNALNGTISLSQPDTIIIVARQTTTADGASNEMLDGTTTRQIVGWTGTTDKPFMYGGTVLSSPTSGDLNGHMFIASFNGATSNLYVDNSQVAAASGNAGVNLLDALNIGGITAGFLFGAIEEVIAYSRNLSLVEQAQIAAYVKSRTGIVTS